MACRAADMLLKLLFALAVLPRTLGFQVSTIGTIYRYTYNSISVPLCHSQPQTSLSLLFTPTTTMATVRTLSTSSTHLFNPQWNLRRSRRFSSKESDSSSNPNRMNWFRRAIRSFPNPNSNPWNLLKRSMERLLTSARHYKARLRALPATVRRILIAQMILVLCLTGSIANKVVVKNSPPRPIEISYSSFLDLVEGQASSVAGSATVSQSRQASGANNLPKIDQVRIGTDRIVYRLVRSDAAASTDPDAGSLVSSLDPSTESKKDVARRIQFHKKSPYIQAYTRKIPASTELMNQLRLNDISFSAATAPASSSLALILRSVMAAFYFLIMFRLYKTVSGNMGGGGNTGGPGKLAAGRDLPRASFDEIQGIDGVKLEVMELVDVLRNPQKYAILGARAPTGLLLAGPSGTGKTMLARATAASAGVPLIYCCGSDFVEMFVGRGAARVRQLFERAQKIAPCIIFIDELDALGKSRDFGLGGGGSFRSGNDEAEQTLNQLLACMDGLDSSRQICVVAATNRREVLDPALIRPGRFDRIVKLELPNAMGREKILRVHASKLPGFVEGVGLDTDRSNALGKGRRVDLSALAAVTEGFSGAELEFLVNEAAIRAVRRVSSALQQGRSVGDIVPHVEAKDFEESLRNFYDTRKPKGGAAAVNELLKSVWKQ